MKLCWHRAPAEILYGSGSAEYLKGVRRKRTALIFDYALLPFGPIGQIIDWLQANQASLLQLKVQIGPGKPCAESANDAGSCLRNFEPDLVIAVGGGSTIELAKAAWALYEHPRLESAELLVSPALPSLRKRARLMALPTTFGSGAEVSPTLGIYQDGRFRELRVPSLVPDRAILDPNLLAGLPFRVAAETGFDAISHAVEAYFSTIPARLSDVQSISALSTLLDRLESAVLDSEARSERESILYASSMAGVAGGNKRLGLAHALADALEVNHGLRHGEALAFVLPQVMLHNASRAPEKAESLAQALNLSTIDQIFERMMNLRRALNLEPDGTMRFKADSSDIARDVLACRHLDTNPGMVSAAMIERILKNAFDSN